ncbi:hemagglutinin repeat-containing protein [Dyella sp.]|uniref:hemagglutinin repeat-containing protein n=1 Tax=Dyella sp. TaxID=1869338 RepID=UPI002D794284|nr:hemagglutinin repeat-containing protein [Dyella sp.]HET7329745.1 hemagglutinin repeat-containing protein [Dyella sp.]
MGLPTAHAQTVPDGATHTNVIAAPNGTPVVNIAAPNNAGVSHNTYQQFNVSSNGLVLNNSGAISNTQLAGYITGNPNLGAGQSANVILNEVTSTQPSVLNGAMEVAGRAAQVIVANPNGITCGGCGFINAPRGTLVTGVPILDANGGLAGFNVTGGTITVNSQGLLSDNTDQVDLLARAVAINAGVWARQLNVVTGSNRIDYATLATQPLSATGATPAVALDVSALGGMYANAIRLVGTEAGLGVNSQGQIAAQNGDLTITNAGQVVLGGKTTATGNLGISATQALTNQGTLAAGGAVTLSGSDLSNNGTLYSGSAMSLSATGQLSNSGQIEAQNGSLTMQANGAFNNAAASSLYAGGAINLSAASFANAGTMEAAQGANVQIAGNASNSGTLQADAGNFVFNAGTLNNTGTLSANGSAALSAASTLTSTGTLVANGNVSLSAAQFTTAGTVQAGSALTVQGGTLTNSGKLYALGGAWMATLSGAFANQAGGDIYGSQSLVLNAASLANTGGIEAQQASTLALGGAFVNSGKLQSDQADITLSAASLSNTGTLSAYHNLQAQLSGTAQNSGVLVSGAAMNIAAASLDNQASGQMQSGTDLSLAAATQSNEGSINAKGNATLTGADLSNAANAQWIAGGALTLRQTGSVSNAGVLQAGRDLALMHAASLTNAAGATMYAGQDFNLGLAQTLTNAGMLYATRTGSFAAGSMNNSGTLRSAGTLALTSNGSVTSSGAIQAQQHLSLQSGGDFSNSGQLYAIDGALTAQVGGAFSSLGAGDIYSGQTITFNTNSFANAGTLEAKQAIGVTAQGSASNSGTVQADNGNLAITGSSITNQGKFSATADTQLSATGALSNSGTVVTGGTLALTAASLANSKQMQSGGSATVQAASVTNSGTLQAGGALSFLHNATLTNQTGGQILAAQNLSADTATLLDNAGVIQAGGQLVVNGSGALTNEANSTLYGAQLTTLQLGGAFTNAGTAYGAQGFNLSAASLANTGSLRSGSSLSVTTRGDASNAGTVYALGNVNGNISGALANTGVLAAQGNTTVNAASLSGNGTLAASLQGDGSLGSSGDLIVTTTGTLADHGKALAAGTLSLTGGNVDLSNSQVRANTIALTANQGGVSNANGDLAANTTVTITTPGSLINTGGKISATTLALQAAALNNQSGSLVQTGSSDLDLSFTGAFINAGGTLATNAQNLSIRAASIDNSSGGTLQSAGNGTLTLVSSGDLVNNGGTIAGNGALSLQANGALNNSSGTLQSAGALNATANTLDNSGGFIKLTSAQALSLTTTGTLTNGAGGFIGGNGAVTVNTGSLSNAGQIYAGTNLGVTTQGALVNNGGALQALASSSVTSGGALSNRAGRIEAGSGNSNATLSVNAASLDDTNGRIANTAQGATTVSVAQTLINEGGTLGGQGVLTLSASNLDNNNAGKVVAGQTLTLNLGGMSNNGGTVYAGSDIHWNNGGATLLNANGSLQSGGGLAFALAALDNNGGSLASNGNSSFNLGSFTGVGKVAAGQNLSISVGGDYTNAAGNQLSANNDLTLNVGGNFSNASGATLQAPNNLTVTAANIDNTAGATVNSNATTLSTGGTLSNEGNLNGASVTLNAGVLNNVANIIGGTVTATAGSLTNGSDLGSATDNNAYQSAIIAGSNSVALYVSGTLLNRDATIFTTGDITIGANASGGASQAVTNLSGDIEANGSITLNANQFTNQRRVFQTSTYNLSGAEQAQNTTTGGPQKVYRYDDTDPTHKPPYVAANQVLTSDQQAALESYCGSRGTPGKDGDQWCNGTAINGDSHNILHNDLQSITTATLVSVQRLQAASAQSRLLAGGNITLNGSVLNDKSTIAAGNNLVINGQNGANGGGSTSNATVQNIAFTPTGTLQETIVEQAGLEHIAWDGGRHWAFYGYETWGTYHDTVQNVNLGNGQQPAWMVYDAGPSLAATMSAGNAVSITGQTITNTTVNANGQPVQNAIGLGANGSGQAISGAVGSASSNAGSVKRTDLGTAPGLVNGTSLTVADPRTVSSGSTTAANANHASLASPQVVSTLVGPNASIKLPQTGLYAINTQPGSAFLIETNPQFTKYSNFISSDYMLQKLNYDPHQTEQRLGDGFYEQQQVLDQITQLTGRRFLADSSDALDQYRNLMNNAVQVAQQFNLSVGVALTPEQMANLTQDMVWLVSVNVDGHQVLEPVVYLSAADAKHLAANGATIAGKNVTLNASGDITNNGTIAASQNAQLTARNLLNSGTLSAGNDLSITAAQNILNGGSIQAGGNVALQAGGDVLSGVNVALNLGAVQVNGLQSPSVSPVALSNNALLGSISAGGTLAINAGRDLKLDTAPVAAGGNLSLAAGRDLTTTATAISAGGNAQLLAGRNLDLLATGTTTHTGTLRNGVDSLTHTVSTVQAGGAVTLIAGQDLTSQAAQLTGSTVNLGAGHDVTLQAVTDTTTRSTDHFQNHTDVSTGQTDQTVRGTTIAGSHGVSIAANHDLTVTAGTLSSTNGNVALAAGNNLTLTAADETHSSYRDTSTHHSGLLSSDSTKTHDATSDTYAIGTAIHGNNVVLAAGNNLATQAAQLTANNALSLSAINNVTLGAGQDTHTEEHDYQHSSFNFFSDSSKRFGSVDPEWRSNQSSTTINQTTSIGSTLSGDTVTVAAGHDLTGTAVQIAGTHDVTLAAGHDLTLNAGQDTYTETQSSGTSHTGLMNGGGFSVLIGNKSQKTTTTDKEVSYTGSLVGSTNGAVTLTAGNNVHITGSDVLSQTATTIVGKNVTIDAAVGSQDVTQTQTIHQGGIHVGLSGGAISAAQNVYGAAQGISQSHDSRLQALYAMQAAQTLFSPGAANGMGLAQGQTGASAIAGAISDPHLAASGSNGNGGQSGDSSGVNLQIGLTGSTASQKQHTHDDITYGSKISSNGDVTIAATGGDLNVIGSTINGNNVALSAAHDINLLSQAEQHTQTQTSSNASAGVGVSLGTNGFNVYVQASMGKANAHGNGETHTDTSVTASNTLSLLSGNDTTIQGAQATGKTVLADIGHNLTIASEQDTNDYASKQWQAGGTVMFGMGGGGSFSYNQSTMKNNYASVTQMSGIGAGSGGFDIQVGGNTDLKGAVIASSAGADKNILDTTSLTYSNIQNQSRYSASSFGVGGGGSASSFSAMPTGLSVPQSSSSNSTTDAAISPGTIIVRNDPNQDLSGLSRTASLSNANGLSNNFDPQKIAENQQLGILAGQVGMTAAGDIEQAAHLKNGSAGAVALHTVVGGAMAALGGGNVLQGAAGAGVSEASIPYLQQSGALGVLAGTTLIGAAVGGGSGAATALAGTQYNYLTHPQIDAVYKACQGGSNTPACQQAVATAKAQSLQNDLDLKLACADSNSTGCLRGLGMVYTFTDDSSIPSVLSGVQQTDRNLVSADYFGTSNFSSWQDLKTTYYQLQVGPYQPPTAGQIASGELQGVAATVTPFINQNEGPNPDNPFVPFQPGQSAPTSMTGMPAGVQQGYAAGQQIGQMLWMVGGEWVANSTSSGSATQIFQGRGPNNQPLTLQYFQDVYGADNIVQGGGNALQMAERVNANIAASQAGNASSQFAQLLSWETAYNYYTTAGFSVDRTLSHLQGIDFTQPVTVTQINPGTSYVQYVLNGNVGNYFAPVGTPATMLGINPANRTSTLFTPITSTSALQTTAASVVDTWTIPGQPVQTSGGGTQLFVPNKSTMTPSSRQ